MNVNEFIYEETQHSKVKVKSHTRKEQCVRNNSLHVVLNGVNIITIISLPLPPSSILSPEPRPPETHAVNQQVLQPIRKLVHFVFIRAIWYMLYFVVDWFLFHGLRTDDGFVPRLDIDYRLDQILAHVLCDLLTGLEQDRVQITHMHFRHVTVRIIPRQN